jgi:hypothetical protein
MADNLEVHSKASEDKIFLLSDKHVELIETIYKSDLIFVFININYA